MQAPKSLRRPENWQDFETLCEFLWREIWKYQEIKKNGRPGQKQHGVDISGIPSGQDGYYGIQCKKKNEYLNTPFTDEEIIEEIEMAKSFQPPLKKLYLATTAIKDAKIEEFVRIKNIEHIKAGLFEVHIYSWEDIVSLIDRYPETHAWYVKSQNFKMDNSVSVTFQDGLTELTIEPQFYQLINEYTRGNYRTRYKNSAIGVLERRDMSFQIFWTEVNFSYNPFQFQICNTGSEPIEEYKLLFEFDGEVKKIAKTNEKHTGVSGLVPAGYVVNNPVIINSDFISGTIIPTNSILVSDDTCTSQSIFLKPLPKEYDIIVKWSLISKRHKDKGTLKISVKPIIKRKISDILIEDDSEIRCEIMGFEDLIFPK